MFELPKLNYSFKDLEKSIDGVTMEIHYSKHHAAYINNLNTALEGTEYTEWSVEELLKNLNKLPENIRTAVRNNAGGHYNHSLFWELLSSETQEIPAELASKLEENFGSIEEFKAQFAKAAMTRFGSGWAWLVKTADGKLVVTSTANQDSPLMEGTVDVVGTPVLGLDVWEHAYYLRYQNRRVEYVENFWNVINWSKVAKLAN